MCRTFKYELQFIQRLDNTSRNQIAEMDWNTGIMERWNLKNSFQYSDIPVLLLVIRHRSFHSRQLVLA